MKSMILQGSSNSANIGFTKWSLFVIGYQRVWHLPNISKYVKYQRIWETVRYIQNLADMRLIILRTILSLEVGGFEGLKVPC